MPGIHHPPTFLYLVAGVGIVIGSVLPAIQAALARVPPDSGWFTTACYGIGGMLIGIVFMAMIGTALTIPLWLYDRIQSRGHQRTEVPNQTERDSE